MKTVHLYGSLAEFGGPFDLDIESPAEAVRALSVLVPGFKDAMAVGQWSLIKGPIGEGERVTHDTVSFGLGGYSEVHILPVIEGASGLADVFVGVTMMSLGVMSGNWKWVSSGWKKTTGGITDMFVQTPKTADYGSREGSDERPSFLFDGPTNTSTQGLPVPVIYGRVKVGSVVISAGISSEEV